MSSGKPISPIEIAVAEQNSAYWKATEDGTLAMAKFLVTAGQPDRLEDAPGGKKFLTTDNGLMERGKSSSLKPARVAIQANCQSLLGRRSIREVALVLAISSAGNATGV